MILRIRTMVCLLRCLYLLLAVIGDFAVKLMNIYWGG